VTVRTFAVGAVVFMALLGISATTHGTVYVVTKTQDTNDGACNADCSLREAILAANGNAGADDIQLGAGTFVLTIAGAGEDVCATGDLDLWNESVSITGQGPGVTIIDATGLGDRVFDVGVDAAATVNLEALTVTGGSCTADGGGILLYDGHLVLDNVVLRDNQTTGSGGGVYCYQNDLTVQGDSIIANNAASTQWYGGGIACQNVTITDSTVSDNLGGSGGGISNIYVTGNINISGSTFAYNRTENYDGGAIHCDGAVVAISNSTLVGNESGRMGGAIYAAGATANVTLDAVTLSGNSSPGGESLRVVGSANMVFTNSLISGSCYDGGGLFSSSGGNLESPGNTCGLGSTGDDVNVVDPMLAPIAPYGGPTQTMFPLAGSPAIGSALNGQCLAVDQRGEQRNDGACDVGAVERQAGEEDPIFVDGFESGNTSVWTAAVP
jgi:CSLREA domain-containing protein